MPVKFYIYKLLFQKKQKKKLRKLISIRIAMHILKHDLKRVYSLNIVILQ